MDYFISYRSPWIRLKTLDYLQNLLMRYNSYIGDDDVFLPLDCPENKDMLLCLVGNLPGNSVKNTSERRMRNLLMGMEEESLHSTLANLWNKDGLREKVREMIPALIDTAKRTIFPDEEGKDLYRERVRELQETLKLTDIEVDILLIALLMNEDILNDPRRGHRLGNGASQKVYMISLFLNTTESEVLSRLRPDSALRRYNCLDEDLDIPSVIIYFLSGMIDEPLAHNYFRKDQEDRLPWSDFADLTKKHGAILKRMLKNGGNPVNILLYGAPGTGKTSFARALAAEVGRTLFLISQSSGSGDGECRRNSSPEFRFGALMLCDSQVESSTSLIVVDEADEMLRSHTGMFGHTTGDKGLLNSVLDSVKTSTIWITNTPADELDESSRRRFDYSIRFEPLNCEQRKRIWKNNVRRLKLGRLFPDELLERFSAMYPVSAGGIAQALVNIEKLHPRKKEVPTLVDQLMKPHCQLLGIRLTDEKLLPAKDYSLEGLNIRGEMKLERIVEAIRLFRRPDAAARDADRPRMNLLLSGPSGTGKTEFVKYLGNELNARINVRMGGDLLSKYVGETEQNIRDAFAEAEAEHAILFLDEIDGLVQSRMNAGHSWEVTQVNELLYRMENFNGVLIGATNFLRNLDQAVLRRFIYKLEFDFLDDAGKRLFFERMFRDPLSEEEKARLAAIPALAPGDFRTVRQSLFYYGGEVTNAMRLAALEHESESKDKSVYREHSRIGF